MYNTLYNTVIIGRYFHSHYLMLIDRRVRSKNHVPYIVNNLNLILDFAENVFISKCSCMLLFYFAIGSINFNIFIIINVLIGTLIIICLL